MAKCPDCPAIPGWIFTYGDTMTLLMIFFVLLLTFAQMDKVKFKEAAGSLSSAFGVQRIQVINAPPTGNTMIATNFTQEIIIVRLIEKLRLVLDQMVDNGEAEITETDAGFMLKLNQDALFQPNTQQISPEYEPILQQIANQLVSIPNLIHVTGHTDNSPVDPNGPFPSNWAKSSAYAAAVVDLFVTKGGVNPTQLTVRGMGAYAPIQSNDTPEGRAANRRIEISITTLTESASPNQFIDKEK